MSLIANIISRGFGSAQRLIQRGFSSAGVSPSEDCTLGVEGIVTDRLGLEGVIDAAAVAVTGVVDGSPIALSGAIITTQAVTGAITDRLGVTGVVTDREAVEGELCGC